MNRPFSSLLSGHEPCEEFGVDLYGIESFAPAMAVFLRQKGVQFMLFGAVEIAQFANVIRLREAQNALCKLTHEPKVPALNRPDMQVLYMQCFSIEFTDEEFARFRDCIHNALGAQGIDAEIEQLRKCGS